MSYEWVLLRIRGLEEKKKSVFRHFFGNLFCFWNFGSKKKWRKWVWKKIFFLKSSTKKSSFWIYQQQLEYKNLKTIEEIGKISKVLIFLFFFFLLLLLFAFFLFKKKLKNSIHPIFFKKNFNFNQWVSESSTC